MLEIVPNFNWITGKKKWNISFTKLCWKYIYLKYANWLSSAMIKKRNINEKKLQVIRAILNHMKIWYFFSFLNREGGILWRKPIYIITFPNVFSCGKVYDIMVRKSNILVFEFSYLKGLIYYSTNLSLNSYFLHLWKRETQKKKHMSGFYK